MTSAVPVKYSTSDSGDKYLFFLSVHFFASSLLLDHFFFFLSIDICTAPRMTRPLCNSLERRTQGNRLLLTILSIFSLP
jgi:hypothetical protein